MSDPLRSAALALSLAALLVGCSGGGGSTGGTPVTPPPSSTSTKSVSGSIVMASGASASKSNDANSTAVTRHAEITLHSYKADGSLIGTTNAAAGDEGTFSASVTLHNDGGHIVIEVTSPHTAGWFKRINYTDPTDIDIRAELRAVHTIAQDMTSPIKVSAENGTFTFGVIRQLDGTRKAVSGAASLAAAKTSSSAAGMELEINIPAADIGNPDTLLAELATFDPSNPDDARSFPGDYLDEFGNRLVSVAFDSVKVTDEEGTSVSDLAGKALAQGLVSKSQTTGVTVRRWIPSGTCASVEEFWNAEGHRVDPASGNVVVSINGNNIPIYTYNPVQGAWDLLGAGEVETYSGGTYTAVGDDEFSRAACDNGEYYLNISISSEDYINAWWNLDYPLLTSQPVEKCVDVAFTDNATPANALAGIYAELSGTGLTRVSGSSRSDGRIRLSAVVTGGTPAEGTVSYYNPYDYSYHSVANVSLGNVSSCTEKTIAVAKPRICKVTGTITKGGAPLSNAYVWAYSANPYAYGWSYTGSDGRFSTDVRCDIDMGLYVGSGSNNHVASFRVNGVRAGNEVSDEDDTVSLGSIDKPNTSPYAYGYLSSYSVRAGTQVTAYVYGWDADGSADYPLTYTLADQYGTTYHPAGNTMAQGDGYKPIKLPALADGTYDLTLTVTDQDGASGTTSLRLTVSSGNRAPVISHAYADTGNTVRLNRMGEDSPVIRLYGHAYDPDGDVLTTGWTCAMNGAMATSASVCNGELTQATATAPANYMVTDPAGTELVFTYSAHDGESWTTRDVRVSVLDPRNSTPRFTSETTSPGEFVVRDIPADVEFAAYAEDADNDRLSYVWKVDGDEMGYGNVYTFTVPANTPDGDSYLVTIEVSDGIATIKREFTVTYNSRSSDTEIIIQ